MSVSRLTPYLISLRRRLRLRDGWLLVQRTLWLALAGMVGVLVLSRLLPIRALTFWLFTPPTIWLYASLSYAIFRPQPFTRVARRVDLELCLKERLSTAIELESSTAIQSSGHSFAQSTNLPRYQLNDALATARVIEPGKAFPLYWLRRPTLVAAGFLIVALILIYLPNPMDSVLAERAAVEQAAQEQADEIEEIKDEIEQSSELAPEMQAELLRQLEELAQQLRENPGDREKALTDLSRLEEELRRQLDPNFDLRHASLESITAQLESLAQQDDINPPTSAEALKKIAENLAEMTATERQEVGASLAQMAAQAAQTGDQTLAQALAAMSQAALSGDSQATSEAAGETSEALAQAQQEISDQQALQQALSQLQNSSQAIAQAGQQGQSVAGQTPGQGKNPVQGNNPGQGQSGQGRSGGGTKADTLPPGTGSGQTGRPAEMGTDGATSQLDEQVYIPWERRSEEGAEVSIPGQDTGQGEAITRENPNPSGGLPGNALIPYQQAYTQYLEAVQQAINRSEIPTVYRDLVRDYFTQLEP